MPACHTIWQDYTCLLSNRSRFVDLDCATEITTYISLQPALWRNAFDTNFIEMCTKRQRSVRLHSYNNKWLTAL